MSLWCGSARWLLDGCKAVELSCVHKLSGVELVLSACPLLSQLVVVCKYPG
jgi:hypothetical protein